MALSLAVLALASLLSSVATQDLPTSYEYYTSGGISSGVSADQSYFLLNGKNVSIYSGAVHYFRVPRAYWRDRLKKTRAAGLNTVESYIPWNLHEPYSGVYDFGDGGSEMEDLLHIEEFLTIAQEEDLFVILRSGPFIASEFNFGGLPSWLLREHLTFRTKDETFMKYVSSYYDVLLPILAKHQFTKGGPVIMFQIENEYGNTNLRDTVYLEELHQIFLRNGIVELLTTCDSPLSRGDTGTLPGVFLQTANLGAQPENQFERLLELQPNKPLMVMEFWVGTYDFWGNDHSITNAGTIKGTFERILKYPASVNIYMFHGGTNFGFNNGARSGPEDNSEFQPITTSYDYDAPLTESGDYTVKYFDIKELIAQYNPVKTFTPTVPDLKAKVAYPAISVEKEILLKDIIAHKAPYMLESENLVSIEMLDINNKSGQTNGYTIYRKENVDLAANTVLKIGGHICDVAVVLIDGVRVSPSLETKDDLNNFGYWRLEDSTLVLTTKERKGATIDILVENWGRMSSGKAAIYNKMFKGLWQGDVYINDNVVSGWKIIPLEFKKSWTNSLQAWSSKTSSLGPALYYASLDISGEPSDTYIDMRQWTKGLVIVNGFPLGKYAKIGAQQALYLPGPFLKQGQNSIVVFEQYKGADQLNFVTNQIWNVV